MGITRAREELHLSRAVYREFRGQRRRTVPSLFLVELPRGEMEMVEFAGTAPADWQVEDEAVEFDPSEWDFSEGEQAPPNEADAPASSTSGTAASLIRPLSTASELGSGPASGCTAGLTRRVFPGHDRQAS